MSLKVTDDNKIFSFHVSKSSSETKMAAIKSRAQTPLDANGVKEKRENENKKEF